MKEFVMASQMKCDFCDAPASKKIKSLEPHLQDLHVHHNYCGECEPECFKCGDLHPALTGSCSCLSKERNFAEEARWKAANDQRKWDLLRSGNVWGGIYGP